MAPPDSPECLETLNLIENSPEPESPQSDHRPETPQSGDYVDVRSTKSVYDNFLDDDDNDDFNKEKKPVSQVERFDKANKTRVKISCSHIIQEYNAHVGGVDLMNSFIGRYRIGMRSRKWYLRIFYHLLDMTVINSWLVYKYLKRNEAPSSILNLCHHRLELAEVLANVNNAAVFCTKRGRPRTRDSVEMELQAQKRRGPVQHVPPKDIRTDNVGHRPDDCVRSRCKMPRCKGYTQTKC
ncbi:Chimeric ERCC6-PGBD3 protein [Eumeta japonica]|uniref:Chimeric ERCC6-PGBD3 protein n=1 Tax=Eumeta variegata TaxID=151549 RepID=A0A4C1UY66_EUMVA|nr:Chimeric ERCC6-PGBD3 protein [Eumeta japonica]